MRRDIPLTLAASASDANAPWAVRYATRAAAFGPRPGRMVSSSAVAVLMLMIAGAGSASARPQPPGYSGGALRLPHRRDEEQRPQDNQRRCGSRQRCEFPGCLHGRVPHFLLNFNYSTLLQKHLLCGILHKIYDFLALAAADTGQRLSVHHNSIGADGLDALPREDQVIIAAQQAKAVRPPAQDDRLQPRPRSSKTISSMRPRFSPVFSWMTSLLLKSRNVMG